MNKQQSPALSTQIFDSNLAHKIGELPSEEIVLISSWLVQKSPHTQAAYKRALRDLFLLFPKITIKSIQIGHLILYIKQKETCKPATIKFYKDAISSLLTFCENTGYLNKSPAKALDSIRVSQELGSKVLTSNELGRMIECETSDRNRLLMTILYYAGLRISEALKITLAHFKEREDGYQIVISGKGGKVRSIFIGHDLFKQTEDFYLQSHLPPSFPLFSAKQDPSKSISAVAAWKIIKRAALRAKIGRSVSPHWFRHTSATHAIQNGAPIHVVQQTLGHASIATTGKYLEAFPKESNFNYLKKTKKD